ncbi:MAG: DNA mismatch repair endonuclease MutL [Defluviitaleaceae bacterium]|nr:DNA mismatch repair endonuclease MutL [Defluviitaleaceae bacterium]
MNRIRLLDSNLIDKIAAGEVVERPSSVVKELVENAVDAGASLITVEVKDGGLSLIRVTDNGCGIEPSQLKLAFARHATSKIATGEDLFKIGTLGFRGEALASVASVSQTEIISKAAGFAGGARMDVSGGVEGPVKQVSCADGTTVVVSNLFYNIPARRKFLKKPSAEAAFVSDIIVKCALGNPGIAFRHISEGRTLLQTNGSGDLKTAIHYAWGREAASKMVPIEALRNGLSLSGYIGKPEISRGNRQYACLFVNGRHVKNRLVGAAAEEALKHSLVSGRFPVYVLNMGIALSDVDVNVHPSKTEIRFINEEEVYKFAYEGIKNAYYEHDLIPEARLGRQIVRIRTEKPANDNKPEHNAKPAADAAATQKKHEYQEQDQEQDQDQEQEQEQKKEHGQQQNQRRHRYQHQRQSRLDGGQDLRVSEKPTEYFSQNAAVRTRETAGDYADYAVKGFVFGTYWLIERNDSLYFVDQHAAHERIVYEELLATAKAGESYAQMLLEPLSMRLYPGERQSIEDNCELLERFGFGFECLDGDRASVVTAPYLLNGPLHPVFFHDLLDKLGEPCRPGDKAYENKFAAIAMSACKAAVKANDAITETEAHALIAKLFDMENPFSCPHGRPSIIEVTKREIERKFRRT